MSLRRERLQLSRRDNLHRLLLALLPRLHQVVETTEVEAAVMMIQEEQDKQGENDEIFNINNSYFFIIP